MKTETRKVGGAEGKNNATATDTKAENTKGVTKASKANAANANTLVGKNKSKAKAIAKNKTKARAATSKSKTVSETEKENTPAAQVENKVQPPVAETPGGAGTPTKEKKTSSKTKKLSATKTTKKETTADLEELEEIDHLDIPVMTLPKITEPEKDMELVGLQVKTEHGSKVTYIDPRELVINWSDKTLGANPRKDYGSPAVWKAWQKNIAAEGIKDPIFIYKEADGRYHLSHGFRRMKAMLEILALNNPNFDYQLVPVVVTKKDEVAFLKNHFTLNTSLSMNEIEMAQGIRNYMKLTRTKNIQLVARELGIEYVKATQLNKFINSAHRNVAKAVSDGVITFSRAKTIVKVAKSLGEQADLIEEGRKAAAAALEAGKGNGKIRAYHMKKVKAAEEKANGAVDTKIVNILTDARSSKALDKDFIDRMLEVVSAIREGKDEKEIEMLLHPVALAS